MTFLARDSLGTIATDARLPSLSQRGRSAIQFLGAVQKFSAGPLRARARTDFESDPDGAALCREAAAGPRVAGRPGWLGRARDVAQRSSRFRFERFLQRVVAEEVYLRGVPAVEEKREEFARFVAPVADADGPELDPSLQLPEYYRGVQWHLQPGGWDAYDLYGPFFAYVAGPHIFRHGGYAAVEAGDDILAQRLSFARQLRGRDIRRIYEPGCGGVSTLACMHKVHAGAELIGSDLSPLLLRMGHATAQRLGVPARFKQRDLRATREANASFDAVVLYAVLHEMPPPVAIEGLREAYRILRPGGELVNSDPPPFRAVEPFQAVVLDWDTHHREEPFFSAAASADWTRALRDIGFVDVEEYGLGRHGYPWITRARKPG